MHFNTFYSDVVQYNTVPVVCLLLTICFLFSFSVRCIWRFEAQRVLSYIVILPLPFTLNNFCCFLVFFWKLSETNQLQMCMESHMFWNIINFDEEFLCYSTEYKSWWYYIRHTCVYATYGHTKCCCCCCCISAALLFYIMLDAPLPHFIFGQCKCRTWCFCVQHNKHSLRSLFPF